MAVITTSGALVAPVPVANGTVEREIKSSGALIMKAARVRGSYLPFPDHRLSRAGSLKLLLKLGL